LLACFLFCYFVLENSFFLFILATMCIIMYVWLDCFWELIQEFVYILISKHGFITLSSLFNVCDCELKYIFLHNLLHCGKKIHMYVCSKTTLRSDILKHFFLPNTYTIERNQRKKEEIKRNNITKMSLYMYCVKKKCQNVIFQTMSITMFMENCWIFFWTVNELY
jgi:hypothetical protein